MQQLTGRRGPSYSPPRKEKRGKAPRISHADRLAEINRLAGTASPAPLSKTERLRQQYAGRIGTT